METLILSLYGLWFWLTRKYRATRYNEAASTLSSARSYLSTEFASRASTRDRGDLLPHQAEALDLLERHSALTSRTSRRFHSLRDCCRFLFEELAQPQPASPQPTPAPAHGRIATVAFLTPAASAVTSGADAPSNSTTLLAS